MYPKSSPGHQVEPTASTLLNLRYASTPRDDSPSPGVSLIVVRAVLHAARELGIMVDPIQLQGVELAHIDDPALALARAPCREILLSIARATRDPEVMLHIGRSTPPSHFHFVGPLLANQPTARKAIELMLSLRRSVLGGASWHLHVSAGRARLGRPAWFEGTAARLSSELDMSIAYHAAVRFWGTWAVPSMQIEFDFEKPASGPDYERFFGTRVRFGAAESALVCPDYLLDYVRPGLDPEITARITEYARFKYMHTPDAVSWTERVEGALREASGVGALELPAVARECRVSARTIRRRLLEEHTTFSDLRARVRMERAARLLVETDAGVQAISAELGYSDANSFRRAFQKWSSLTPVQYRVAHGPSARVP